MVFSRHIHRFVSTAAKKATKEASLKHVPFGETGAGNYSDATRGCFDVLAKLQPLVLRELEGVLLRRRVGGFANKQPFRILDVGTADGGTSMPMLRNVVAAIREEEPDVPIEVVYEDQAQNDWVSLFNRVQGTVQTQGAPKGLSDLDNIYPLASGLSFYECSTVPGTVDLAFSSTAMHWLTSQPCDIPDALHSACSSDPTAKEAYAERAAQDWRRILSMRAMELKSGGALVVANFAVDEEGQFLGHTPKHMEHSMHHQFADIWRELVTPAEFTNTNFPNQYRSLQDCAEPFGGERAERSFQGLRLVSAETARVPCPFRETYKADPSRFTPEEQARRFIPTTRTWSNSTFATGLTGRSEEERHDLVDTLFQRYEERVAQAPNEHGMDYVHSYLAIVKED